MEFTQAQNVSKVSTNMQQLKHMFFYPQIQTGIDSTASGVALDLHVFTNYKPNGYG